MARSINDIYNFMVYVVRKQRGTMLKMNDAIQALNTAQLDCFEDWFKGYGETQEIHDALQPFKITTWFSSNSSGLVAYPSDCLHLLTLYTVSGSTIYPVRWVNEDELVNALASQLRPVSAQRPIARDNSGGVQLYPQTTQLGTMIYLKRPTDVVLGYTQVGRDVIYNPNTSVQFEFNEAFVNNIIARSFFYVSENMDEAALAKFSQMYQQETQ